ncbi:MAG: FeoB small GTPase domain-containing protein [Candidatus Altiarchaeota archaeon]|nr:FeoB small GTPase domain-containing protein [Candidatus Altiarchaeota archaeon]
MKRILLMGNPNVGKSVFFNKLTGIDTIQSNYPGTTVDYTKGYVRLKGREMEIIDVPGTFSLEPKDKAEEVAVKMLEENKDSVVVCVLDASKIERGLYLALEVIERGYPVAIALNMWDDARAKKIDIDVKKLETILGVPVVPTIATTNEGLKELVSRIGDAATIEIDDIIEKANHMTVT